MFMLRNEPRVVEFFNSMAKQLVLYIGSDLLIKCLSEHYLTEGSRLTVNALEIIRAHGAKIILTQSTLEEIYTHIKAADLEFRNHYAGIEPLISQDLISELDRILIRAYFYAKLGINAVPRGPRGWMSYIGQFCSYEGLQNDTSQTSLRNYLCDRFGLRDNQKTPCSSQLTTLQWMAWRSRLCCNDSRAARHRRKCWQPNILSTC